VEPKVHKVNVGKAGDHTYDPEITYADVGDVIVFRFYPTNHSVVRGDYAESIGCGKSECNPCIPYELLHPEEQGFHSGQVLTQVVPTNDYVCI
jgi:plastocyanin